ncbi:MAG: choice-of-anchor D domain-containing protein [Bacteroidetes bacterium]|nr:choice-of-anchor D domain-containing protein [Bacteroidota bacterium]
MRKRYFLIVGAMIALMMATSEMRASLADYGFQVSQSEWMEPPFTSPLLTAGADDETSDPKSIGFSFVFDGQAYTQFTASSNGLIGFGPLPVSPCWLNQLTTMSGDCDGSGGFNYTLANTPHIAAYWDDMRVPDVVNDGFDGVIDYGVIGDAPNRILVISYRNIETDYFDFNYSSFQVRLYEGTNRIEFYYDYLNPNYNNNGASIGMATSSTNFLSVSPDWEGASTSTTEVNDYFYPSGPQIPGGTVYEFVPCQIEFTGDLSQGGTVGMLDGDVLLSDKQAENFSTTTWLPFSMGLESVCSDRNYTATITGLNANDYSIDPDNGTVSSEFPTTPSIIFHPTGIGVRRAQLTIADDRGNSRTFNLAATSIPRIEWIGNIDQGGTPTMANRDALMGNIHVRHGESGDFTPLSLMNISENQEEAPPAQVTYSIRGISGGQYTINPSNDAVSAGGTITPTITFSPRYIGTILDSLVVTADGETRVFALTAVSDGTDATLSINNEVVTNQSQLFVNQYSCSGVGPITLRLDVKNIGTFPFDITGVDFFLTDTTYTQGQPSYPLRWDSQENPVRSNDYVITEQPPVIPITSAQTHLPLTVDVGTTKTFYLTFISQEPGKRFARAFIHTNSEVLMDNDPNGEPTQGLLSFALYGRGTGGQLSDNPNGGLPKSVLLPATGVGDSSDATVTLFNTGTCDLRIGMNSFTFTGDDADEFKVISMPSAPANVIDPTTNDLVLAPGQFASVTARFHPSQIGSRRATMRLQTSDSSIVVPGITERGSYYLDFYGNGSNGVYANSLDFGNVVISATTADHADASIHLVNLTSAPVTIASVALSGPDAADFGPVSGSFPTSFTLMPTNSTDIAVRFAPTAGSTPGDRNAVATFTTTDGITINATLHGVAGTRDVSANPGTLAFAVSAGKLQRKNVKIVNIGTLPLTLGTPALSGANAADFTLGSLPRLVLAPGQTEYLEVTFQPTTSGSTSSASITIPSDASTGPVIITLNGSARTSLAGGGDPSQAITGGGLHDADIASQAELLVADVAGESTVNGITLRQSIPNPGRDQVQISYVLPQRGDATLELYDANGALVRIVDQGHREAGERTVTVDVSALPSGQYHYRLNANGVMLTRSMVVVR